MNRADSELIAGVLSKRGFELVDEVDGSDIIIVNTCIVKTPTEHKILNYLKWLEDSYDGKVIVAGCMAPAIPEVTEQFSDFSFIGINSKDIAGGVESVLANERFVKLYGNRKKILCQKNFARQNNQNLQGKFCVSKSQSDFAYFNSQHKLYCDEKIRENPVVEILPIAEGCLGNCAYCQTRLVRGALQSYPPDLILKRVKNAVIEGVKEIWLTSQDSGAYGSDLKDHDLVYLLNKISEIKGDFFVRVGMMNPAHVLEFLDELIDVYGGEKIYKFLHLPVQSGDDKILKDMNREYAVNDFKKIIGKFRRKIKGITISTDIIVGFPTEDEDAFNSSIKLIEEIKPDVLNISRYWERAGTEASKKFHSKKHPGRVTKQRSRLMTEVFQKIGSKRNKKWVNWKGKVLVSEWNKEKDTFTARNFAYKPIIIEGNLSLGDFIDVEIKDATYYDLRGVVL